MTATAHSRGWPIEWRNGVGWIFSDTMTPHVSTRACRRCGRAPMPEGYDACLGYVAGVTSACCGHGVHAPFSIPNTKRIGVLRSIMKNPWETGQVYNDVRTMTCDTPGRLDIVRRANRERLELIVAYPDCQKAVRLAAERRLRKLAKEDQ